MHNFDDITDYRDLLRLFYQKRKAEMPLYSYRMMGHKLGIETSQICRIIQKEYHLPIRCIPLAKQLLGLTGRSGEYFELLAAAARTRSGPKRDELFEKAYALRDVARRKLEGQELRFLRDWWIPVVRAYIEINHGEITPELLARQIVPSITVPQAKEAIEILLELGFIQKLSSHRYSAAMTHFTVKGPEKTTAVRSYQKQILQLGQMALDTFEPADRDISTLTLAVDADGFDDLKEMAKEFRRQVQKRAEEALRSDRVMQLSMAFFPVIPSQRAKNES